jgi:hypothetical protein
VREEDCKFVGSPSLSSSGGGGIAGWKKGETAGKHPYDRLENPDYISEGSESARVVCQGGNGMVEDKTAKIREPLIGQSHGKFVKPRRNNIREQGNEVEKEK